MACTQEIDALLLMTRTSSFLHIFPHPATWNTLKRVSFTFVFQKIEVTGFFPS